ncbi:MAG: protein rep [Desulfobacteraceae bacterium]|nr:protein rep [Desulfobacteraceae bacterium]
MELSDRGRGGKERPWGINRYTSQRLAEIYYDIAGFDACNPYFKKASRISNCGSYLTFVDCDCNRGKKLVDSRFCRVRLCPLCQWRKSLFVFLQFLRVAHEALRVNPKNRFLFLTLTERNVTAPFLDDAIDRNFKAWHKMTRWVEWESSVCGSFRSFEVTWNPRRKDFHHHLHAILEVRPSYFGKYYLSQADYARMWRNALGLDYTPVVYVEPVKAKKPNLKTVDDFISHECLTDDLLAKAAAEVSKYTVKISDYLYDDDRKEIILALDAALKNRRLIDYKGTLKRAYKRLNEVSVDKADLVSLGECGLLDCPVCNSELTQVQYRWSKNSCYVMDSYTRYEGVNKVDNESGFDFDPEFEAFCEEIDSEFPPF